MNRLGLLFPVVLLFASCATAPHTYQPPSPAKLKASTARVSKAVDAAHESARRAQTAVKTASQRAKEVATETKKLKDVPPSLLEKVNDLETRLDEASKEQTDLERSLQEADQAKAQVEKDKVEYFGQAQNLADSASKENASAVAAEKKLSWYRWHWWGSWIALGAGVLACAVFAFLKFTGRLAITGSKFL